MSDLFAVFGKPLKYQVAALRLRFGDLRPTTTWKDLQEDAHNRAFVVAGATKADMIRDFALAMDKAVAEGTGIDAFAKDFRKIVAEFGWPGKAGLGSTAGEAWRIRTIYRTNMRTSFMAGRFAQLVDGNFKFWVYRHGGSIEPRLQHLGWDGLILPAEHPFWLTHYPPNGWGCNCRVFGADSLNSARRLGGKPDLKLPNDWQDIDSRTGTPKGIGKGWAYAPGASVAKTVSLAADKIASLPPVLGSDLGASMADIIDRYWPVWLADVEARGRHQPGLVGVLSRDVIQALSEMRRPAVSADLLIMPGLVSGPKARRHTATGDALTEDQWLMLPQLVRSPKAVLIDRVSGKLLFILAGDARAPQLAVELDQLVAPRGRSPLTPANLVVSAYQPKLTDILGRVAGGLLSVLLGGLG